MSFFDDNEDDIVYGRHQDHEDGSPKSQAPRCKYCGSRKVYWVHSGVRWRLYNADATKLHVCNHATPDDFDDLT